MSISLVLRGLLVGLIAVPASAFAYVGPGAGLSLLGSLIGVVGVILLAGFGVVIYPLRQLWLRFRHGQPEEEEDETEPAERENGAPGQHRESG